MKTVKIPFEFLPIPGYEGYYEVNPLGTVRSIERTIITKRGKRKLAKRYMDQRINNRGYREVRLNKDGKTKTFFVHILVAKVFHENPDKKCCVNHLFGNKLFNPYFALEFVTHQENMIHAYQTGLIKRRLKPVVDLSTGKMYSSAREAARANEINYKTLVNYLNGNRPNPTRLRYKASGIRRLRELISKLF